MTIAIHCLTPAQLDAWLAAAPAPHRQWVAVQQFAAKAHTVCALPAATGGIELVLCGLGSQPDMWALAHLPAQLPEGDYTLAALPEVAHPLWLLVGTLLAQQPPATYKTEAAKPLARIALPAHPLLETAHALAESITHGRNLINEPANILGPVGLERAAKNLAERCGAQFQSLVGDGLLAANYPTIHMVGRAAAEAPRLIELRWGNPAHPKITLVGKGVTFDSGGLNIKTGSTMKLMKKDMGGAAAVLALAEMIMRTGLPVRLRVLVPAVENAVSAGAMRPLDIVTTRKGITVEVGDTDAEGRLILCDALADADDESPELLVDCATLTGASRVALGTEIPSFFTQDDALAAELQSLSFAVGDPLWRLPLWSNYRDMLKSDAADMNNVSDSGYAGAITAALFLDRFVTQTTSWVHIDMMAWNTGKRPGRPAGGEIMGARVLYSWLAARYPKP